MGKGSVELHNSEELTCYYKCVLFYKMPTPCWDKSYMINMKQILVSRIEYKDGK